MSWEIHRSDGIAKGDNAGPLLLVWKDKEGERIVAKVRIFFRIFLAVALFGEEEFALFLDLFCDLDKKPNREVYADYLEERNRPIGSAMLRQGWSRGWENFG